MSFVCPRCGRDAPEVLGAPDQRCPHCGFVTGPARLATGELLAGAARDLVRRAPTWWGLFLVPALAVDATTVAAAWIDPQMGAFLTNCGATPQAPTVTFYLLALLLAFAHLAAYFLGWTMIAAEHAGAARDAAWWRRALGGSVLLTALFLAGFLLAVLPALVLFVVFLLAPAALGAGASPVTSLDRAREATRRRPTGIVVVALLVALAAEGALLAAGCIGGFWTSLAAQGLVWWLLAPIVPVLTAHVWSRVAQRMP